MHDTNRSGWWILIPFLNLYYLCLPTVPGNNRFGDNDDVAGSPVADAGMEKYLLPVGRSGWAITSGYLGLFSILVIPAPFALFTGVMAYRDMRKHPEKIGMGRTVFGIVMGLAGTVLLIWLMALYVRNHT
jgi:hypothetical protein